jgi:hypothetical protein
MKKNYINKYELNIKRAYLDDEENKAMIQDYLRSTNEEGILILKEYGFDAITYMPSRNTRGQL